MLHYYYTITLRIDLRGAGVEKKCNYNNMNYTQFPFNPLALATHPLAVFQPHAPSPF